MGAMFTWCHRQLPLGLQDDFATVVHGWKHALLEEYHILLAQAKVVVLGEELFGRLHCSPTGHNVPGGLCAGQ